MKLENLDIFHKWQPREIEALRRATAALRAKQPEAKPFTRNKLGVKGCWYNKVKKTYIVQTYVDGICIYAGSMQEWDEARAYSMQHTAEKKYLEYSGGGIK